MKKLSFILLLGWLCLLAPSAQAVNVTIGDLTADASPTSDDLVETENDPSGIPGSRKVSVGNLIKGMSLSDASDADDVIFETELDTEAELEAQITDMTNIIQASEIDTYSELNTIVADQTLIHSGLIDTYSELNTIVADVTMTHNGLIDTFSELNTIVADKTLVNTADAATITADYDFGGGTLQVPNSTTLPGTCEVGDAYMDTDATSGQRWYLCESANTWALQGGAGGGSGAFSDASDPVVLNTDTKDVQIGSAQINSAKLSVDGDADQEQFAIQAHSTQTSNVFVIETSAGSVILSVDVSGNMTLAGTLNAQSAGVYTLDSLNADQIEDIYFFNTGDTGTGDYDFGGATSFEIPNTVVGSLPAATAGRLALVTDGANADDCTTGSGSTLVLCMANGSTWEPTGDSGSGGSGAFSDASDPVVLNTTTKDVSIGDGAGTLVGKLEIGGDADQPQLVIEGHSTQTDDIFIIQQDDDTEVFSIGNDGTIQTRSVDTASVADADFGDFTCSSGSCTFDADTVAAAEMADADHGDVSWSSGVATVDNVSAGSYAAASIDGDDVNSNIAGRSLTLTAGTPDTLDVDAEIYTRSKSFVLESPADADAFLFWKAESAITITDIHCIVSGGTSAVIDIQECSATGTTCTTVDATITCDTDGAEDDGTLTNGAVDLNDWINLDVGTVTGTVSYVTVEAIYTVDD